MFVCSEMQISGVVGEQELGLRQMLRTMGMLDSSYWLSWMVFEVSTLSVFVTCQSCAKFQECCPSFPRAKGIRNPCAEAV